MQNYGTIWVCQSCMLHDQSGECGDCHREEGHDCEPLSAVQSPFIVFMGMHWSDHNEDCLTFIVNDLKERFPDMVWPDVPGDYECDCGELTHSTFQCEGCNSWLHSERYAMTLYQM